MCVCLCLCACVCVLGTKPGPEYHICHPNPVTTTHVWRRILCIQHTHLHSKAFTAGVCVCVGVSEYHMCTMSISDILACAYVHVCRCVCRCDAIFDYAFAVCLCDRLTYAQMVDDEHMSFTSHFTCWHDNSVKAHVIKVWKKISYLNYWFLWGIFEHTEGNISRI